MARVHYWELSNYNNGRLVGRWFDLDGLTHEEHMEELKDWLNELTEETGELCEEWILGDAEDVPSAYVGEWGIDPKFFEIQQAMEDSSLPYEVFEAGISLGFDPSEIDERYYGYYESYEELAQEYVESGRMEVPEHLEPYIDYERLGRDLSHYYCEHNNYYFYSY